MLSAPRPQTLVADDPDGFFDALGPAAALLEVSDIPLGFAALDALAKEAPVRVIWAGTAQHGHFLVLFTGEVEAVELSFARACQRAGGCLVDTVLLPHAEPRLLPAVGSGAVRVPSGGDALGIVQTGASPTLLRAVDAALKGASVDLCQVRLAEGLAGRGLAMLWGHQTDVEAALDLASQAFARGRPAGCSTALVANADFEVARALMSGTRFFKEHRG
jgi:microcompartment protein CcmL/EutN